METLSKYHKFLDFKENNKNQLESLRREMEEKAIAAERQFLTLKINVNDLKKEGITDNLVNILLNLNEMIYFLTPTTKKYLEEQGFNLSILKWFISFDEIETIIDKINEKRKIYLNPFHAVVYIQMYLRSQILNYFLFSFEKFKKAKSGGDYNLVHLEFLKYLNKTKNNIDRIPKNANHFEIYCTSLFMNIQGVFGYTDDQLKYFLSNYTQGNGAKLFLNPIVVNIISLEEELTFDKKIEKSMELFLLLLKGKFLTKEAYTNSVRHILNRPYERYLKKRIKDLITVYNKKVDHLFVH